MYNRLAVLFDESKEGERAFSAAVSLSKRLGAELEVCMMMAEPPLYSAYAEALDPEVSFILDSDREAHYSGLEEKARSHANAEGVTARTHVFEVGAVQDVLAFLKMRQADLLVLGLHHKGSIISRLWRKVYEVAEDAPCSVLGVH